jgi:hypothetical protein
LNAIIANGTGNKFGRFKHRDFVRQVVQYCDNEDYTANIGIVFGLRSTGKTVGMLQAAESLIKKGHKVAFSTFHYDESAMGDANLEISVLADQGYTHFFVDEATYLEGFLNSVADWPDSYVIGRRIKIIISGTDSFLLSIARETSLFHRCEVFPANWCSYAEFCTIQSRSFAEYRQRGGVFARDPMPAFIQAAIVDNLINSVRHCVFDANRGNAYSDSLARVAPGTMYKAIISILKCTAEEAIISHFVEYANEKNIMDFGNAVSNWTKAEKQDIKQRVADVLSAYADFKKMLYPEAVIELLISSLVRIGCLEEATGLVAGVGAHQDALYYFSHPALMTYAVFEI